MLCLGRGKVQSSLVGEAVDWPAEWVAVRVWMEGVRS